MGNAEVVSSDSLAVQTRAEIDIQIATAKQFPRDIARAKEDLVALVCSSPERAEECEYSIPRGGKTIEGPSVRFAEAVFSCWKNLRLQTRILSTEGSYVLTEAAVHDLESNVAMSSPARRRITDRSGNRYNDDLIDVTARAAISVAYRNVVLKVIPRSFWGDAYDAAKSVARGTSELPRRRLRALGWFEARGVAREAVLAHLGRKDLAEITVDDLAKLNGLRTAIAEETTSIETVFGTGDDTAPEPDDDAPELVAMGEEVKPSADTEPKGKANDGDDESERLVARWKEIVRDTRVGGRDLSAIKSELGVKVVNTKVDVEALAQLVDAAEVLLAEAKAKKGGKS